MIYEAVRSLILAAPKENVRDEIRAVIEGELDRHGIQVDFLDIVKTGRRMWIDVYIIPNGSMLDLKSLKEVQTDSENILNGELEDDVCVEIIPELKDV